ncbi:MAG: hypothetical protein LBV74_00320 [Tannerella sp.]|nr:hypothetical protein [Tannerella sp.]
MKNVEVWSQVRRPFPSIYPIEAVNNSDIRNELHSIPTYMAGSDRDFFSRVRRNTGISSNYAYPMDIYKNGKFLRSQYQSYRKR